MIARHAYGLDARGNRRQRDEWLGIVGGCQPLPGPTKVLPDPGVLSSAAPRWHDHFMSSSQCI